MNIEKLLIRAGVPEAQRPIALACLAKAKKDAKGLTWAKWKVRLFKAGEIADILKWGDERLLDVRPDLASWDIAPMVNVTAYGDHINWNPLTGKPAPGTWMDEDPNSADYKQAVEMTGEKYIKAHPRTHKFHKFWYRRNGGEFEAWARGVACDPDVDVCEAWINDGVRVLRCGNAWQVSSSRKIIFGFGLKSDFGYEVGNLWNHETNVKNWYPIPGHELRAPLSYGTLPGKVK